MGAEVGPTLGALSVTDLDLWWDQQNAALVVRSLVVAGPDEWRVLADRLSLIDPTFSFASEAGTDHVGIVVSGAVALGTDRVPVSIERLADGTWRFVAVADRAPLSGPSALIGLLGERSSALPDGFGGAGLGLTRLALEYDAQSDHTRLLQVEVESVETWTPPFADFIQVEHASVALETSDSHPGVEADLRGSVRIGDADLTLSGEKAANEAAWHRLEAVLDDASLPLQALTNQFLRDVAAPDLTVDQLRVVLEPTAGRASIQAALEVTSPI